MSCVAAERLSGSIVLSIAAWLNTNQAFQVALDLVRKNKSTDVDQALGCCSVRAKHLLLQTHFPDDRSSLITWEYSCLIADSQAN